MPLVDMASRRPKRTVAYTWQQHSTPAVQTQAVNETPSRESPRRSARIIEKKRCWGRPACKDGNIEPTTPSIINPLAHSNTRKRKRSQSKLPSISGPAKSCRKRPRIALVDAIGLDVASADVATDINPIKYWTQKRRWPKEYLELESRMSGTLARKKSSSALHGRNTEASSATASTATPSDQKPREIKSIPYQSAQYKILLETKGVFMRKSEMGIDIASKDLCQSLLESTQSSPEDSLFQDALFDETCEMIHDRNEAKVIQDIARLIVPSVQSLDIRSPNRLKVSIESVNEGWNSCIPLTLPRPQPDYSVGFRRSAFTEVQLKQLKPFVGGFSESSFFMATYYMFFPFLTCEVKCGAAALDVADRQNAHSMTLAVRGVVELFRLAKREKELHRKVNGFSVSHDDRTVRIYAYYAEIDSRKTTYYRHPIHTFDFTALDGKEKWTAYKFTRNVYDVWMPMHFQRICSVIDGLPPDVDFEVPKLPDSESSGLSQAFYDQDLSRGSGVGTAFLPGTVDGQSISAGSATPNTSFSNGTERGKKRRTGDNCF